MRMKLQRKSQALQGWHGVISRKHCSVGAFTSLSIAILLMMNQCGMLCGTIRAVTDSKPVVLQSDAHRAAAHSLRLIIESSGGIIAPYVERRWTEVRTMKTPEEIKKGREAAAWES